MVEAITGTKKIVEGDEHLDHVIKHKNQEKEPLKDEFLTIITTSILSSLPPVIVKSCGVYNLIMVLLSVGCLCKQTDHGVYFEIRKFEIYRYVDNMCLD